MSDNIRNDTIFIFIMKQKIIKTDKATLLVVEMPEGKIHGFKVTEKGNLTFFKYDELKGSFPIVQPLPKGNWQLLGRLPDITDSQADGTVEKVVFEDEEFGDIIKYRDYAAIPIGKHNKRYAPITALKSLSSLLQANEVYFENPLGVRYTKGWDAEIDYKSFLNWQEAQSKVWDKERCYLFIKVD